MRKRKQQEAACRVEFPACYRMDHFREERLWVRSHIQILQLKPYGRSGHLNFFICNETKQGMATPPQNTQLLQGHFFKNSELLRASHALEMVFFEAENCVPRPDNLGWSVTSASKLTTVSRPLASADTAYMMVSLQHKKQVLHWEVTSGIIQCHLSIRKSQMKLF